MEELKNGEEKKEGEEAKEVLNPLDDTKPVAPAEEVDLDTELGEKDLEDAGVV